MADSRLSVRGDLASSVSYDSDNDGGWTCYWVLSECFRYQVTGDAEAKAHFDKSLERMLSLQTLTGTDHFLARSVIRKDGCLLDDCDGPDDGEWFTSPDSEWWVKGDTSNDEVTSHMFMMAHAYDLCADADQQAAIRQHVSRIIGGIIDNGYQLNDIDGECTTYGQFDPFYVNEWVEGAFGDGGRRSAQILAALSLAYYMTGDEKFMDAKRYLMDEHHYGDNVVRESEYQYRKGSGDGDELGTQAFFVLLRYESDPELRAKWLEGWRRSYGNTRLQAGGAVGHGQRRFGRRRSAVGKRHALVPTHAHGHDPLEPAQRAPAGSRHPTRVLRGPTARRARTATSSPTTNVARNAGTPISTTSRAAWAAGARWTARTP